MRIGLNESVQKELEKKRYGIYNHSGVEICEWNRKALRGEGDCYKAKFYNAHTSRCMQFSPAVAHCNQNCLFCWRPNEVMCPSLKGVVDDPKEIVENLIEARKKQLMGFGGNSAVPEERFIESLEPDHFAISLSGEPTLYPKIIGLIEFLCKRARSVFLVTNGTRPDILGQLRPHNNFQIYISCNAPNEEIYKEICRPAKGTSWEDFLGGLDAMREFLGRTVLRMTFIRGLNDRSELIPEYQKLIERSGADFIEVKSFMSLGYARKRLEYGKMLYFDEIREIAEKLLEGINYRYEDEHKPSRIVLLKRKDSNKDNFIA
jgi:tRNA wybutosine-synthesizing protein 1